MSNGIFAQENDSIDFGYDLKPSLYEKHKNLIIALEKIKKELTPGVAGYHIIEQIINEALNEYR